LNTVKGALLLPLDLQFFAKDGPGGEKTEKPTAKKLDDSRKEGQVAKSMEISNAFSLVTLFLLLRILLSTMGGSFFEVFHMSYGHMDQFVKGYTGGISVSFIHGFIVDIMIRILLILLPFFAAGVLVAVVVNLVQVKWKPTGKPLKPKLSKLNPVSGFKRLFSKDKLVELLKSIVKVFMIFYVAYTMLRDQLGLLLLLYDMSVGQALSVIGDLVIDVGLRISLLYIVLGFVDYGYQRWKFMDDMKMTKQEVKDEIKNSEGDPQIKSQQRRRMREASMRRMMSSVPQADVVITNPTHFAVALKYDNEIADAPIVVAKGQDYMARRIKEIAADSGVAIVENKPLARMIYHNVPIDGMIPPELYQAVAEVLAFVYNLKR
jgi:flagellar biosynthetic protein FlhB